MSKCVTSPKIMRGGILEAGPFLVTASQGPYTSVFSVAGLNPLCSQFTKRSGLRRTDRDRLVIGELICSFPKVNIRIPGPHVVVFPAHLSPHPCDRGDTGAASLDRRH